ncbi:MAG: POTRA domain-containing protein [Bacteroidota bacterium]|nr:POTRA domain-containing protein [Bacteroidota bacterium]
MTPSVRQWVGLCILSSLLPSQAQPHRPRVEIVERIVFHGNTSFPSEELQALLRVRAATRGPFHRILNFYAEQLAHNPSTPPTLLHHLQRRLAELETGLPTLDPRLLETDTEVLRRFYIQQGFHWVQVNAHSEPTPEGNRVVHFFITEGAAARIDTLVYLGLEKLPPELQQVVRRYRRLRPGMRFREAALLEEVEAIRTVLREHGYPHATYERPQIHILPDRNADSIVVHFLPGPRLRFGQARFVEATTNTPPLTERVRQFCTEFSSGQWYDLRAVERTRLRLLRLGVFEVVRVDTLSSNLAEGTVELLVSTRYRRFQEASLSTAVYRTPLESAPNVGVEAQLSDANLLGGAEKGQLLGQISLRDPFGAWERKQLEYEFQLGAGILLPYIFRRIGLSSRLSYGIRLLASPLRLEALVFQMRLPVEFAPWTWMTTTELALDIRAERPVNYRQAAAVVDTLPAVLPFLRQYERLYTYTSR